MRHVVFDPDAAVPLLGTVLQLLFDLELSIGTLTLAGIAQSLRSFPQCGQLPQGKGPLRGSTTLGLFIVKQVNLHEQLLVEVDLKP